MILIGSLGVFFYNYFLLLGTARLKAQTAFVINELWSLQQTEIWRNFRWEIQEVFFMR